MAGIDDPIDAIKKQYPNESNVAFDLILGVAGKFDLFTGVIDTIRKQFSGWAAAEKVAALLNAFERVVRRLERNVERLQAKLASPEFVETLTVAVSETIRTSNMRKVERFAAVLGYSVAEEEIRISFEDASAFIRDLAQLGETDIEALSILNTVQSHLFKRGTVPTDPNPYTEVIGDVHTAVDRAQISREDFYSRCSRLSGFGLTIEVMRNNGRMAPGDHCFRVTRRGSHLINLLRGPVET
jgi:hypothetical protein